ncbi:MAG: UDP-N-acetylglucosamine 1-carboxyvinyltransferase [Actinomycetota bacterium]|nr:UDP-N-acetylglucosamine 1-carboxyvinyltransferase [Actinomycetota bacterium]PLS75053.1 MAG: UDP-N-acetylglucosamine 1-carboxyvinyltransferase [Actinomycetota bacterium]
MSRFVVRPGPPLSGSVRVSGAKNSVLKLLGATLLAEGTHLLRNVPRIADVETMCDLLVSMGVEVERQGDTLHVHRPADIVPEAPYELVERMRASIVVLGPLLARVGAARVSLPGGDDFGTRPVDDHLSGLERLGATFELAHGVIDGRVDRLLGNRVLLEVPSHTATDTLVMAAVLAKGTTVIENAAREPEVADLAAFLNRMGARVVGAGSSTIVVEGVDELTPVEHEVIPDRVEAATFLAAVGIAGGEITVAGARPDHMDMLMAKLGEMGMRISPTMDGLWASAPGRLRSADVSTLPYPGVATDYLPLLVAMLAVADGVGIVTENLYGANRFTYVAELSRMGADVRVQGHHAVVRGVARLSAAPVKAPDLRAGAALVLAGLRAEGETVVTDGFHLERGYEELAAKLTSLGADVTHQR